MEKALRDLTILLVDDEQFIRQLVGRLLRDMGVREVINANDGEEASQVLHTYGQRVDLIVLDLEMPHKDGFQVIGEVRQGRFPVDRNLPIVILTGHGQMHALKSAVQLGIHGFLVKPMSRDALEKRIRSALRSGPLDPGLLKEARL